MSHWVKPWNEQHIKPLRVKPRRGARTRHRCRKGWRWLTIGEWVEIGDLCCDPRMLPVRIEVEHAWKITQTCHPVMRKIMGRISFAN